MSHLLDKIKRFFKRSREEDETSSEKSRAKRARYVSTPATIKFHPKQVHQKRVIRQSYLLDELLDVTEDRNYEFKSGGMLLQKSTLKLMIQKYGSAFLNSEGGVLIGGVTDTGKVIGINCSVRQEVELEDTVENEFKGFRPCVDKEKYTVKFLPVKRRNLSAISGLKVVEIHVYKGDDSHLYETGNHEVYIRRDGGVQGPLRPLAIKDLVEQKYQKVLISRKKDGRKDKRSRNPRNQSRNKRDCEGEQSQKAMRNMAMIDLTKDSLECEPQKATDQHLVEIPPVKRDVQGEMDKTVSKQQPVQHNTRIDTDQSVTERAPAQRSLQPIMVVSRAERPLPQQNMRRSLDGSFTARPVDNCNRRRSLDQSFTIISPLYQGMQATTGQCSIQMSQQRMQGPPVRPYMNRPMVPSYPQGQQYMQAPWNTSFADGPIYTSMPPVPPMETVAPRVRIRRPRFALARKFISDVKSVFK